MPVLFCHSVIHGVGNFIGYINVSPYASLRNPVKKLKGQLNDFVKFRKYELYGSFTEQLSYYFVLCNKEFSTTFKARDYHLLIQKEKYSKFLEK